MPALLGYLVALALLLGGGYAGLEWLGSPDEPAISQHRKTTASAANKHAEARKAVASADATAKAENVAPVGPADTDKAAHDEAKLGDASANPVAAQASDAASTDGCKPIGLTVSGQMVFPLQCRETLEAKPSAAVPAVPEPVPAAPEPKAVAQNQDAAKAAEQSVDAAVDAARSHAASLQSETQPTNSAPASEPTPPQNNAASNDSAATNALPQKTSPPSDLAPKSVPALKQSAEKEPAHAAPDRASPTNPARVTGRRSFAEIRAPKPDKPKSTPDRSGLVKMTLLTIEYPDGHREQRLVPYRRFRDEPDFDDY